MPIFNMARSPRTYFFGLGAGLTLSFLIWLWSFSPLAEQMDLDLLFTAAEILKNSRFTYLFLVLAYILASLLVFPFSVLDAFTLVVFGPVQGAIYAYFLSSFCALWMFILVRYFRKKPARIPEKILPAQWAHVLNRPGFVPVAIFRNLPIAFSINNLVFALSPIKARDYLIGTLIGNIFPITFLALLFDQSQKALLDPSLWQFACLALVVLTAFSLYRLFRKRMLTGRYPPDHSR